MPVRSHSTTVVTSLSLEVSSNRPFDESFSNVYTDQISKQTEFELNSMPSLQQTMNNSTPESPNKSINNSLPSSKSPTCSYNLTQPDVTQLVSPQASMCSTPVISGSESEKDVEYPSSDESWGKFMSC